MYLLRVDVPDGEAHVMRPNAKIPLVELPAADPFLEDALATPTPAAVEEHVA